MSCLLTYNGDFNNSKWEDFLEWVRQCEHFHRWTATMEQSLHSAQEQRLHVHLFVEFGRKVDWNSLRLVSFDNITPNCRVTQARESEDAGSDGPGPLLRLGLEGLLLPEFF